MPDQKKVTAGHLAAALVMAALTLTILSAAALIASAFSSRAEAKTVCRVIHNHQVCHEVQVPMPPKPDPRGQQRK